MSTTTATPSFPAPTSSQSEEALPRAPLSPAAERALAEAALRRQARAEAEQAAAKAREIGGRAGPDPVRYGDWENGGIAWDF